MDSDTTFKSILDHFRSMVHCYPDKTALICNMDSMSYLDLDNKSDDFKEMLLNHYKVLPGEHIGLITKRKSLDTVIALIGILKANAVFLPLSPDLPPNFVDKISKTIGVALWFTDAKVTSSGSAAQPLVAHYRPHDRKAGMLPTHPNIVYSIYTSGTTSDPKGVSITHSALLLAYHSWQNIFALTPNDNHLQMAQVSFDVFIGDCVRALCSGGTLVLCQHREMLSPKTLCKMIRDYHISVAEFVPVVLNKLIDHLEHTKERIEMRLLLCGSDLWMVQDARKAIRVLAPGTEIYNTYGLTEVTIDSTYFRVTNAALSSLTDCDIVPIGLPFPHVRISIRDKNLNVLPFDTEGELIVEGQSVTPYGYLNADRMTKSRFITNYAGHTVMFRSGDIASMKPNGCIYFKGRNQHHVNIHGRRVELLTVEHALKSHNSIKNAVVIAKQHTSGPTSLDAYVVLNARISKVNLKKHIETQLPLYACPHRYFEIKSLDTSANGKLNRYDLRAVWCKEILSECDTKPYDKQFKDGFFYYLLHKIKILSLFPDDFFHDLKCHIFSLPATLKKHTTKRYHKLFIHIDGKPHGDYKSHCSSG